MEVPYIGRCFFTINSYARAAGIAKEAASSNRSMRDVATEQGIASETELEEILDVWKMTEGG